ncbi:hypothetical protein DFS34DRAFT_225779 [Phlyctochytrium arcticum]|nr:hypothetical protein DFS34DRAFT_225779 [Phlyctochytrium arcticum]
MTVWRGPCQNFQLCIQLDVFGTRSGMVDSKIYMTAGSRLPIEILAKIASEIPYPSILFDLATVSHAWNQVAQPLLFRSIGLRLRALSKVQLLVEILRKKRRLASSVRGLKLLAYSYCVKVNPNLFADVATIASLCPNLTKFEWPLCSTMNDTHLLAIVQPCKSLEELSVSRCGKITSEGLGKVLPFLKNLRKLNVEGVGKFDNDCLCDDIAKMCPLLEYLNLSKTDIKGTGVFVLMELATKLTSLNLRFCNWIEDPEMAAIMREKPVNLSIEVSDDEDWDWDDDDSDEEYYEDCDDCCAERCDDGDDDLS